MNGSAFEGDDAGEVSSELEPLFREAARTPEVMLKPADIVRVGSKVGKFLVRAEFGRGGMGIVRVRPRAARTGCTRRALL